MKSIMLARTDCPDNRWRRYRERRGRHRTVPKMGDIGEAEITFLVETGWLADAEAADRARIGVAIGRLLADAARRWSRTYNKEIATCGADLCEDMPTSAA